MNKGRRKIINELIDSLDEIMASIYSVAEEEQEYLDNMPENLQDSDKGVRASEVVDFLGEAAGTVDEVLSLLNSAVVEG